MENLIRNNYTFLEAEEILQFLKDKKLDLLIERKISQLKDEIECLR